MMASKILSKNYDTRKNGEIQKKSQMCDEPLKVNNMTSKDFQNDVHAHIDNIHYMLIDKTHWKKYKDTILWNRHLFAGRTVLNLSCGVGLLALFAAKAGAAQVYAVDDSNAADYATQVVKANNYEHVIKIFKTTLQKLVLPVDKIDILICDWFGYSLLFESKCVDVIYARDKWLKTDGIIFPDKAQLYISAMEDPLHKYEHIDWWYDVYGFNMKAIRECAQTEPSHQQIRESQIIASYFLVFSLDLNTAKLDDLKFRNQFLLHILCDGKLDGVFTFFEAQFSKSHTPAYISSSPKRSCTRWLQTVYFFDHPLSVKKGDVYCGGLEMYPLKEGSLNNIEVGFELLKRLTDHEFHLEIDMHWHLKPASGTSPDLSTIQQPQAQLQQQP